MSTFEYVAVLTSIIIGLGITHLLRGVARIIQHPGATPVYWVHLCWVGYVFLNLIFWWWWEFNLGQIDVWTFPLYLFVVLYAVLMFLSASILFPDSLDGYDGFEDYYYSKRVWIFGLLAVVGLMDVADSLAKGVDHWLALGIEYQVARTIQPILFVVAMFTRRPRFHAAVAIGMLGYQASWALRQYWTLN
jgi:hypothetical protein